MMKDCYSPLKVFHHRDRIDAIRNGHHPSPIHVQIIPTNRCNQRCSFCAYRMSGYTSNTDFIERDQIPVEKIFEIVDDCGILGVKAIELTGGGEPTLYSAFPALCSRIESHGIKYGVVSNGVNWEDEILTALSKSSWVRVSIDSARPKTYARLRHSAEGVLERVLENIRVLKFTRDTELKGNGPVIGVGFVVTQENWMEVFEAAQQARENGADNFRISAVFQNEGSSYFASFADDVRDLCNAVKKLENSNFRVFNLFGERLEDLEHQSPGHPFCPIQKLATYIGADLSVYRCCVLAYSGRGRLGSLVDQRLTDLWNSKEIIDKLNDFDATKCPHCMFNKKNETIRYALNPHPDHVEFL